MTDIDRGDIIWLHTEPTQGREQAGHRPHLVLTERRFHELRAMAIVVPLATARRDWPTRVAVGNSFAICEQPRSVSLERVTKVEKTGYSVADVRRILTYVIGGELS